VVQPAEDRAGSDRAGLRARRRLRRLQAQALVWAVGVVVPDEFPSTVRRCCSLQRGPVALLGQVLGVLLVVAGAASGELPIFLGGLLLMATLLWLATTR